ncbi:2-C-methyl-D-erythritol 4-phosphate cytidylyltransferase [Thaumasiovibrio subtropicus]|uniref:2-C-methyl-D-erythritol 4-phosphate cytidylyltransferase n=1 Tax=Thaumasiovibrio subtropicus TaxID=1891207 RepID=UPI000B35A797|nr:2-C-methyl-D-erythritol 4-phosphate cytidylyltransferase [Thaumasiovibrio subtropicus]
MTLKSPQIVAVVPAAGVGKRMAADRPKQYLELNDKTIIEHTISLLLSHSAISKVVVATSADDPYFPLLTIASDKRVMRVDGGAERVDSVVAGLEGITDEWVMVHDAARPCVTLSDIDALIEVAIQSDAGAILAMPVRDTMKRVGESSGITHTVCREALWHALTPQMFRTEQLKTALAEAIAGGATITDEASALEFCGLTPRVVSGRSDNIKVTRPEDLALANFYLTQREKESS